MTRIFAATLLIVGLLLLAGSWFAPGWFGGREDWSETQAQEHSKAAADYHSLNFEVALADERRARLSTAALGSARDFEPTEDDLNAARERYNVRHAALEKARSRGPAIARAMRWSGIGMIALGVACYAALGTPKQ